MKNSAFRLFAPAMVAAFLLSACSFGLVPASSRDSAAIVSLKLGSLDSTSNSTSRAIAQGSGYLYLRTIGGPTGDSGPFYGPYSVSSGGTFSTTDLPAGSYKSIMLLYSANKLDETKTFAYNGGTYTFRQLMQLSDEVLMSETSSIDGNALLDFFDGEVSTGMTGEATLTEGATTALSATLIPICGGKYFILAGNSGYALPSSSTTVKKFYEIYGLSAASGSTMTCTLTPGSSGTATIGTVAFYGADGKLLSSPVSVGTITGAKTITATANGDSVAYLYIEYQASDLTLGFGVVSSSSLSCSFTGSTAVANKTFLVNVYDTSLTNAMGNAVSGNLFSVADKRSMDTSSLNVSGYRGVGLATLDSSGNATVSIYDYATGQLMSPIVGHSYNCYAFIDVNGVFSAYTSCSAAISSGALNTISTHYGDYSSFSNSAFVVASGANSFSLNLSNFLVCTAEIYYVAQTAAGSGSGFDSANACTLATAVSKAASYTGADDCVYIKLTGDVTLNSRLTLAGRYIDLSSENSAGYTIYLSGTSAGLDIAATQFWMTYLTLDGTSATGNLYPAVTVESGSSTYFSTGAKIQNMKVSSGVNGGGVLVSGTLSMTGATIANCSAYNGGGIYIGPSGARVVMGPSAAVTSCSASATGGGICIAAGQLDMYAGSSVTNCSAVTNGGGIYTEATVTLTSATISGCSATSDGGGVYVGQGSTTIDSATTITGNTATEYGGGVYASGSYVTSTSSIAGVTGNTATTDTNSVDTSNYYNANSGATSL